MKKFIALFLLASLALFSACGTDTEVVKVIDEDTGEEMEIELPLGSEINPANVNVTASSTMEDNSGYGFNYGPFSTTDMDFSTAWCAGYESVPTLTLEFPEMTVLGTVGIMPGFGRDEDIFMKNNRIKYLEVWYDEQPEALEEFYFEDKYEMQFFQMPGDAVEKVTFKVTQTYPGSLYNDTCIAEVDFWNDWVEEQDAEEAYEFYLDKISEDAIQPVGVESVSMTTAEHLSDCGSVNADSPYYLSNGSWGNFVDGGPVAVSAKMDEYAFEGAEVTVNWVMTQAILPNDPNYPQTIESKVLEVEACEDGSLYLSDTFPLTAGSFDVELYYGDNLIGNTHYSVAQ